MFREPDTSRAAAERRKRVVFVAFWTVALLAILIAFRSVLVPFVMALLIAYVLSPLVARLERVRLGRRALPRWGVVVGLYIVMLAGMAFTIRGAAPAIADEVRSFARDEVPRLRREIETTWLPRARQLSQRFFPSQEQETREPARGASNLGARDGSIQIEPHEGGYRVVLPSEGVVIEREGEHRYRVVPAPVRHRHSAGGELAAVAERLRMLGAGHTEDILRVGRGIFTSIIGGIFGFFITLMLSAYILVTEDKILRFLRSLVRPESRAAFDELLARIDRGLSGVVRGQLLICAVNGLLSAVGFAIARLPYWPLLALIAAVLSLIPIFGAFLSSVPAVAIALSQGLPTALFVLLWILGIHQLEANLLNPKIMGDAAKIHPVLVVFSLLAGEHFFGILGALLAVPVMSLVQSVFLHWRKYALNYGDPAISTDSLTPPPPGSTPESIAPRPPASEP